MSAPRTTTTTDRLEKLRADYAAAQARADQLRARLAKLEAQAAGAPAPESGLDMLWQAAPAMARVRSSKFKCRKAWLRIPTAARPTVPVMLAAMKTWSRCDEWRKDDGQFVPALDRWIRDRKWEDLPETYAPDPSARYRVSQPAPPPVAPEDAATPDEIAAMFAEFHAKFK